ncbi:hypothetical protein ALC56_04664 [Trachymyrmex septentrionalis]|uniref:Uncharacterized protein n=1 Tax=Trachymyrmex septentrionalis TaxID=34720 RepID=A0A151JY71_9HYME|nr:hypothetical protein ALC56_04664 [Trachymyrmex septentrionalis]
MAIALNGDYYITDILSYITIHLTSSTFAEIAENMFLQNGMQSLFHDVKVDIARCPYLTTAPYNLSGVENWNHRTCNIQDVITISCHDFFIIGSTKPYMPYYMYVLSI